MARIKLGPLITDISGSIGSMTIQRNRFGHTLRLKPLPKYSETQAQYVIRRHIITIQTAWQALTDAQRTQWDRFLDFSGQTIRKDRSVRLSGHKLYLKYQLWHLLTGEPLLTDIAYSPMPGRYDFQQVEIEFEVGMRIRFTGIIDHASYFFICKLSSPRMENQAFNSHGLRWMPVSYLAESFYDISASYVAAFGVLPPTDAFLHYSIRFFSMVSPVYTGVYTGKLQIVFIP